jgi:hypothetical protein
MKADSTIEVRAVVTPNRAIARRSHTISRTRLQKPETRKNSKSHRVHRVAIVLECPGGDNARSGGRCADRAWFHPQNPA